MIIEIVLFSFFLLISAFAETVTNMPIKTESIKILRRFEVKGYLDEPLGYSLPIFRRDAITAIQAVISKEREGKINLTEIEKQLLNKLKRDFYWELESKNIDLQDIKPPRHFFRWRDDDNEASFDIIGSLNGYYRRGDSYPHSEKILQTTLGGILRGTILQGNLGFYAHSTETREDGTKSYAKSAESEQKGYVDYYGNYAYFDRTDAYIIFDVPLAKASNRFTIEMGKEAIVWGPGYNGNLVLSHNPESYNIIKIKGKYKRLRFVSFTGFLKSDIIDSVKSYNVLTKQRKVYRTKYIAGHRFEADLLKGVLLAVEEVAVYGDRSLDIGYLNPIMFYRSYEHNYDDLDNMGIGIDFSLRLIPKTEIYGELFIDDIYLAKINTDWWGNKLAYLAGIYIVEPFSIENADVRFEYAQIEPWVYTHFYPINTYTHDSVGIGHWIGPNASDYYFETGYIFSDRLDLCFRTELTQYGKDGGDIFQIHDEKVDGKNSHFLTGIIEKHLTIGSELNYEAIEDFVDVRMAVKWVRQKNVENIKSDSKSDFEFNLLFDFNW